MVDNIKQNDEISLEYMKIFEHETMQWTKDGIYNGRIRERWNWRAKMAELKASLAQQQAETTNCEQ